MVSRIADILIILACGFIAKELAITEVLLSKDPWLALNPFVNIVGVIVTAVIVHLIISTSKEFYEKYRWWMVGIICFTLLLIARLLASLNN